jgi:hypothetical protein
LALASSLNHPQPHILLPQLTDRFSKGELSFPWNLLLYGYKTIIPSPAGVSADSGQVGILYIKMMPKSWYS